MLLIIVKTIEEYLKLPGSELKERLQCGCGSSDFILWGSYRRQMLPAGELIMIQRVRCQGCGCTHGVLPSFILGRVRHPVSVVEAYFQGWVKGSKSLASLWRESAIEAPQSLSALYRWGRRFRGSLVHFSPGVASRAIIAGAGF